MPPLEAEIRRRIARGRADAGAPSTWRCASADPEHGYYTHARSVRRARRFHHRAGSQPDVRRDDRPVGGRGLEADGLAGKPAPHRARSRPRHHDEGRAARGQGDAGFPRGRVAASGRDQPGAARRSSERTRSLGVPMHWHPARDVPQGPAIILANEFFDALPVNQAVKTERRLARAPDRDRFRRAARLHVRARTDPAIRRLLPPRAARRAATARSSNGAPTMCAMELGRRLARRRRRAGDRLRPCRKRRRRHLAGGAAGTPMPIR